MTKSTHTHQVDTTWFISDLHLDAGRPSAMLLLLEFLEYIEGKSQALYILGDLLEYWIGDDVLNTAAAQGLIPVIQRLQKVSQSGTNLFFIHGNRDFLLGADFARRCEMTVLPEEHIIDLYDTPTLILHGDTLCTDDIEYQQARQVFRNPQWQAQALQLSIPERLEKAQALRLQSQQHTQQKTEAIMDVNPQTVENTLRKYGVTQMIHGHTHRPAIHTFVLDGKVAERIVLGDWYQQGSFLKVTAKQRLLHTHFREMG